MLIVQHSWQLILFFFIVASPLPLCLSLILFTEKEKEEPNLLHCVLLLLVSWCVVENCVGLVLGITQHLNLGAVLVFDFLIFMAGILTFINSLRYTELLQFLPKLRFTNQFNNFEKLIIVSISFVWVLLLLKVIAIPIIDTDSLGYHLPAMANWYQTSSLPILEDFKFSQIGRYPYSWEVLCTLFIIPFKEDLLVAFPNLIVWIIFGLSIYLISIQFGSKRIYSMAASSLVLTLPMTIDNVNTMHVDLPLGAFFIVGLYLIILHNRLKQLSYLALLIAIIGILLGIKTSGIIYSSLLIIIAALSIIKLKLNERNINSVPRLSRAVVLLGCASVFCFLLLGCFWYFRNFVEIGNPLGYIIVKIGGFTIFPGNIEQTKVSRTTLASLFDITNIYHWKILLIEVVSYLSFPFLAMVLQMLLALFLILFKSNLINSQRQIKTQDFLSLIALLIGTLFLYWTTPYSATNEDVGEKITDFVGQGLRYAFPCMGMLGIVTALSATLTRSKDAAIVLVVLISSTIAIASNIENSKLAVTLFYTVGVLLIWGLFCAVDWNEFISRISRIFRNSGKVAAVFILIGMIITTSFFAREMRNIKRSEHYGKAFDYIERNVNREQTIGHLLSYIIYPLYGKKLDKKVLSIPSDSKKLSQWLDLLQQQRVSIVAVGPFGQDEYGKTLKLSQEILWLENNKERFIRVLGQDPQKETFLYLFKSIPGRKELRIE